MTDGVSFGEPCFIPAFGHSETSDIFASHLIRDFAQAVLSAEAWFRAADELIAAMDLLEPNIADFWGDVRSLAFAVDKTKPAPSKHQKSAVPPKQEKSDSSSKPADIPRPK